LTIGGLFDALCAELTERHEAVIVLEEAAGDRIAALFPRFGNEAPAPLVERAMGLAARRRRGEPLQHVLGHWSFRRLDLLQDPRALIVRPETEVVVEIALAELSRSPAEGRLRRALDLGTGSGAIALSLVSEVEDLSVVASDRSVPALELAAANRARLGEPARARLSLLAADWLGSIATTGPGFELIVANPPYLGEAEWEGLDAVVRDFDPKEALVAGATGLEALEQLLGAAASRLARSGSLVCEIGAGQAGAVRTLAQRAGYREVRIETDLVGRDRVLVVRL
jgi:release factor glutamine methyltransferase